MVYQHLLGIMRINSPDHIYPVRPVTTDETSASTGGRIMVPIVGDEPSSALAQLALSLADDDAEIVVLRPVSVPEQTPPKLAAPQLDDHRAVLEDVVDALPETAVSVESTIRSGHGVDDIITNAVENYGITTLVLPHEACEPSSLPARVQPDLGTRTCSSAECNVLVVRGADRLSDITSILVPVAGGPHSGLAITVAAALARGFDASLDVLHVIEPGASPERREQGERYLAAAVERLEDSDQYETRLVEANDIADTIIEESAAYDLTIMGAPRKGRLRRFIRGSTTPHVENGAETAVLTVNQRDAGHSRFRSWLGGGL